MKTKFLSVLLSLVMIAGMVACFAVTTSAAGTNVAQIGTTEYETLAKAIAAANAGDEIVFLADITEDVTVSKNITINGANFKFTGGISVSGSSTKATVKNVNFVGGANYAITTNTINTITVENCTATGYSYGFLYANRSTPTVVVKDVTVTGVNYGFHWVYGTSATLENVTMTDVYYGLYVQNYASKALTLKDCDISSIGIWERSGSSGVQTFKFKGANKVGTLSSSQYAKYVLTEADATVTAPEGYNVTTTVEGKEVSYSNGTYQVGTPNTTYKAQHWLTNIAGDKNVKLVATYNHKGTSGALTTVQPSTNKAFVGYTAQEVEQQVIAADGSTVVIVRYVPNTDTEYKVQHLLMTSAGDKVYKAYGTYTHKGTTTGKTEAKPINIPGYTARDFEQAKIAADGSTMVKIQYDPNTDTAYTVSHVKVEADGTEVQFATSQKTGTTNTRTAAEAVGIVGYTAREIEQQIIAGDGSTVVTVYYDVNSYTLTWNLDGGKFADGTETVQTVPYGAQITVPADPTRTSYTFAGWDKQIPATMPANDVTITATWIANPSVSNVTNELFTIQCTEVHEHSWLCNWYGSHVTFVKDSVKYNEEAGRWEAQAKIGTSMLSMINMSTTKKNYFGGFTHYYDVKSYVFDLYWDAEATGLSSSKKQTTGLWLPQEDYVCEVYCHTEPAEANLSKISTTVIWVRDADAAYKNQTYSKKYAFNKLIDGTYTVGEMYEDGGKFYMDVTITDLTPYIEALEAQNGKEYHLPEWEKHYNSADDFKIILEYTGSTTDYKQDGTGWAVSAKTWANNTEKLNGKSLWVVSKATVTYTDGVDGEEVFADESFTVDVVYENGKTGNAVTDFSYTATPAIDDPTREGHTFSGWTPEWSEVVTEDVDYVATWDANEYTITFVVDGETYATITQDYGTAITAPADPTKVGYTFAGWDVEVPATMPAGDMTITATWDINVYNITIVPSEYGTVVAKVNGEEATTACYGDTVVFEVTTNEGHTFIKLNYYFSLDTGSGAGGAMTTDLSVTMKNGDLRITPVFDVNEYTITFISDGETYATITQDYGTAITAPADPAKTGYTFGGWDKEIPATMPAEDMTITAQWTVNSYTITFISDGAVYKTITQDYGTAITAPADPTKTGYTFGGWDKEIPATMPAENMTITAKWGANDYIVKYYSEYGYATMKDQKFTYDVPQALNENTFLRTGYKFVGWAVEPDGEAIFADGEIVVNLVPGGEITLYAVWQLNIDILPFKTYLIYTKDAEHGEISVARSKMPAQTTVVIKVEADKGYELDTLTAKTYYGYTVPLFKQADGTYTFEMPMAQVNITATFKEIVVEPVHECPAAKFEDIDTEAWYHEAVDFMVEKNLMNGTSETKFSPDVTLNRAMIATILWRLEGEPVVNYAMSFTDVEADQWYTEAIRWAASTGIVKGFEDGTFKPTTAITRQQLALMIYRYAESKGADVAVSTIPTNADAADVADWAKTAVYWAIENGIYVNRDGAIEALADATRAEAAAMIWGYAK